MQAKKPEFPGEELAVSVQAALAGNGDLALGNVVGSNIFNIWMC